ncbi:DNA polymerase delta subunit 3-like [Physella acuta]|uniref:DNA polymerase delta subunit 3-like n=1 Tax=Physella acuta TaxID=109671 RepID=UPI0027DC8271|nr:DNA polymerase delta subunit 3-like [Physella acuta]
MATEFDSELVQENIEEYVVDDSKIVTCKWLSLMLNLNINEAKKALYTFVTNKRSKDKDSDFNVTYFVAGHGVDKNGEPMHKCVVVPEAHIDEVKTELSVVTSCHIYSVQRSKLKDYTPLYMTDYEIIKQNLSRCQSLSSIKCSHATKREAVKPCIKPIETPLAKIKVEKNGVSTSAEAVKPPSTTITSSTKATSKKEPKGSIASMFATVNKKSEKDENSAAVSAKVDQPVVASNNKKPKPVEEKGGVMALFNKQTTNKATTKEKIEPKATVIESKKENEPKKKKKEIKKGKNNSDDEAPVGKQRRRIRTDLFDSSDEEEEERVSEDEEDPDIINCSIEIEEEVKEEDVASSKEEMKKEEEDKEAVEAVKTNGSSRKRKRVMKVVTKHYLDEDGFMVTSKANEWESASDDSGLEEAAKVDEKITPAADVKKIPPPKAQAKSKAVPKKSVSPSKGKQTSMFSYFKKQ